MSRNEAWLYYPTKCCRRLFPSATKPSKRYFLHFFLSFLNVFAINFVAIGRKFKVPKTNLSSNCWFSRKVRKFYLIGFVILRRQNFKSPLEDLSTLKVCLHLHIYIAQYNLNLSNSLKITCPTRAFCLISAPGFFTKAMRLPKIFGLSTFPVSRPSTDFRPFN